MSSPQSDGLGDPIPGLEQAVRSPDLFHNSEPAFQTCNKVQKGHDGKVGGVIFTFGACFGLNHEWLIKICLPAMWALFKSNNGSILIQD